ncbi:MAG TPA: GspH/FimT family pseudopilin [Casimicrobiaceae bacterium]|nr:GspH/FimT family pseudopilin [Casimicrobiaceae bacterium]
MPVPPRHAIAPCHGFSLVELLITIAIFGVLAVMAVPMYGAFSANTQIRTATEAMLEGVRYAQTEAVKRNGVVEFVLDETTGWTVNDVSDPNNVVQLRTYEFKQGAKQTTVTPQGAMRRVTFNGLGRIFAKNPTDNTNPLAQVDVTTSLNMSSPRNLRLVVGSTFGIKACDPALPANDAAGCP